MPAVLIPGPLSQGYFTDKPAAITLWLMVAVIWAVTTVWLSHKAVTT